MLLLVPFAGFCEQFAEARPVEIRACTRERLGRQLAAGSVVLRRILEGPKRWIVGDEQQLGVAA